ncbi:DMT family transporter [Granulosicoccaceae sp. 1_MG-2023]|nr:DMT family transporter [Granulosicoccaceae sp. 1_MG-2023]
MSAVLPSRRRGRLLPYALLLFVGALWGSTFSLTRLALGDGDHPVGLTFWQACGGALILLPLALSRYGGGLSLRYWRHYLTVAVCGTAVPGIVYFYAADKVPTGVLSMTVALVPIFTCAGAWLTRTEPFALKPAFGVTLGLIAVWLIIGPENALPDPALAGWMMFALIAPVFYTFENLYVAYKVPEELNTISLLAGALLIAALLTLPAALAVNGFVLPWQMSPSALTALSLLVVVSAVAYLAFLALVRLSGAVFGSLSTYLITLAGVMWGMLLFGERHSLWIWTAAVLLIGGLVLVTPRGEH